MKLDIETVSAMLANESLRHVQTRVLAQSLTKYTEHVTDCAVSETKERAGNVTCDCGLADLLSKLDAV